MIEAQRKENDVIPNKHLQQLLNSIVPVMKLECVC